MFITGWLVSKRKPELTSLSPAMGYVLRVTLPAGAPPACRASAHYHTCLRQGQEVAGTTSPEDIDEANVPRTGIEE